MTAHRRRRWPLLRHATLFSSRFARNCRRTQARKTACRTPRCTRTARARPRPVNEIADGLPVRIDRIRVRIRIVCLRNQHTREFACELADHCSARARDSVIYLPRQPIGALVLGIPLERSARRVDPMVDEAGCGIEDHGFAAAGNCERVCAGIVREGADSWSNRVAIRMDVLRGEEARARCIPGDGALPAANPVSLVRRRVGWIDRAMVKTHTFACVLGRNSSSRPHQIASR